jgi:thioredoxin-related protein
MKLTKDIKLLAGGILVGVILTMAMSGDFRREGMVAGKKELLLIHMDGCHYCEKLQPEWDKFVSENNTAVTTKSMEKDENKSLVTSYGVQGFPTILLLDEGGKKIDTYKGPRTASGLLDYCQQQN